MSKFYSGNVCSSVFVVIAFRQIISVSFWLLCLSHLWKACSWGFLSNEQFLVRIWINFYPSVFLSTVIPVFLLRRTFGSFLLCLFFLKTCKRLVVFGICKTSLWDQLNCFLGASFFDCLLFTLRFSFRWTLWFLGTLFTSFWSCWRAGSMYNIFEVWLLSSPSLPSWQVNMADICEWIYHLFGKHHFKSRIFGRIENF